MKEIRKIDTGGKAEVYEIEDFLTPEECQQLINLIEANNRRSTVVDKSGGGYVFEGRTSHTADLYAQPNDIVSIVDERMKKHLPEWVPFEKSETPQGQKYEPGQFFNDHNDWFDDTEVGLSHQGQTGQRNWTFMINLNDVQEGGETDFPHLGIKFQPKQGRAVIWKNVLPSGEGNPFTLHAGRPPVSGNKYIITKWFRTGEPKQIPAQGRAVESKPSNTGTFTSKEELPKFTPWGYELRDLPEDIWGYIQDIYRLMDKEEEPEPVGDFIKSDESENASTIFNMDKISFLKKKLHEMLQPMHQEWIGSEYELEPSTCYGIRSYQKGAQLAMHWDRVTELHISGIVCVDVKGDELWPLNFVDHTGVERKLPMKPGQILLYESAVCEHGRSRPFNGEYYRNFYIHYKLKNWTYAGE